MIRKPLTSAEPRVSVVVPTLPDNDDDELVDALARQRLVEYELLLVEDETLGVCAARNEGLEAANADVVAFTDDDCVPPADWLERIVQHFASNDDLVVLEGPVEGGMDYRGRRKYPTCNLAVRRDAALSVGGFRDAYEYWREDTEFGWRLEAVGDSRFADDVRMVHPPRPRSSIVQENERRLAAEYPEQYEAVIVPDTVLGRVNDWLWRQGFWEYVDRIRYRA